MKPKISPTSFWDKNKEYPQLNYSTKYNKDYLVELQAKNKDLHSDVNKVGSKVLKVPFKEKGYS